MLVDLIAQIRSNNELLPFALTVTQMELIDHLASKKHDVPARYASEKAHILSPFIVDQETLLESAKFARDKSLLNSRTTWMTRS